MAEDPRAEDPDVAGPPVGERPPGRRSPVTGGLYAFGRFWREFLIGDTPELFIGAVAVIGVLAALCAKPGLRTVAAVAAPFLVAGVLTLSVYRAVRKGTP